MRKSTDKFYIYYLFFFIQNVRLKWIDTGKINLLSKTEKNYYFHSEIFNTFDLLTFLNILKILFLLFCTLFRFTNYLKEKFIHAFKRFLNENCKSVATVIILRWYGAQKVIFYKYFLLIFLLQFFFLFKSKFLKNFRFNLLMLNFKCYPCLRFTIYSQIITIFTYVFLIFDHRKE